MTVENIHLAKPQAAFEDVLQQRQSVNDQPAAEEVLVISVI